MILPACIFFQIYDNFKLSTFTIGKNMLNPPIAMVSYIRCNWEADKLPPVPYQVLCHLETNF